MKKNLKKPKPDSPKTDRRPTPVNTFYHKLCADWDKCLAKIVYTKVTGRMVMALGEGPSRLLARLIQRQDYWSKKKRLQEDGSFFYKQVEMAKDLCTSQKRVSAWLKKLKGFKIDGRVLVHIAQRGIPRTNYYRLDPQGVKALMKLLRKGKRS